MYSILAPAIRAHTASVTPLHRSRRLSMGVSTLNTENQKKCSHSPQHGCKQDKQEVSSMASTTGLGERNSSLAAKTLSSRGSVKEVKPKGLESISEISDMARNQSFFSSRPAIDKAIKGQVARDDRVNMGRERRGSIKRTEAIYIPQSSAIYGTGDIMYHGDPYSRSGPDTPPLTPATSEPQISSFEMSPQDKLFDGRIITKHLWGPAGARVLSILYHVQDKLNTTWLNWGNINSKYEDIASRARPPTPPHDAKGLNSSEAPSTVVIKLVNSLTRFFELVAHEQGHHRSQRSGVLCENQLLLWTDFRSLVKLLRITGSMHDEEFPETDGLESGKFCLQGRPLKDCPGYCMGFKPIGSKKLNQALSCTLAMVKEPDSNPYTAGQNGNPDISDQEFRSLMKATKPRWDKLSPKLQHIACREITEALILLYLYWGYYLCLEKKLVLKDLEKTELRKIFEEELERQMSVHTSGERSKQSLYYILQVDRPRARRSSIARSKC